MAFVNLKVFLFEGFQKLQMILIYLLMILINLTLGCKWNHLKVFQSYLMEILFFYTLYHD